MPETTQEILERIGLIPVLRAKNAAQGHAVVEAMIAGGVGSITGAFVLAIVITELQNMSLLFIPGEWSIGVTFFIFVIFMLFRPTGLFAAAR